MRFFLIANLIFLGWSPACWSRFDSDYSYHQTALDIPVDGGTFASYSRMWGFGDYLQAGWLIGGGVIQRKFDVASSAFPALKAKTEAVVFPFFGPRVSFIYKVVGISLSYGFYHAKTDLTVRGDGFPAATGETSAWGTGFYSPLLTVDFYNRKWNMLFGIGLGGFFGGSYPALEARNSNFLFRTNESPIDTLTFHVRTTWISGRRTAPDSDWD